MTTQSIRRNARPVRSSESKFVRLRGWASRSNFGKSLVESKHPKLPGYPSLSYVGTEYEVSRIKCPRTGIFHSATRSIT